jgi:hypothetical protein
VTAIEGDNVDIVEWLMDTCKLTTYEKSPLHYALDNFFVCKKSAHWLLKTGKSSNAEIQTEFMKAIGREDWIMATFLIEVGKVNINQEYCRKTVNWPKMAVNRSEDVKLFLRALLPRTDIHSDIFKALVSTESLNDDDMGTYLYRQLVFDGLKVRLKVKKEYESRTRYVENLKTPEDMKYSVMSYLNDGQVGMSTETMWASLRQ